METTSPLDCRVTPIRLKYSIIHNQMQYERSYWRPNAIVEQTMSVVPLNRDQPVRILLVDDEPGTLQLLRTVLQAEGHLIYDARDGEDAVAEFKRIRPDLVLLDVMLPKIDGLAVLQAIRTQDAMAGVIMFSALSSEQLAVRAMQGGADDYLSKPLSLKTLRMHIRQVLERVQLRRQNYLLQEQLVVANEKLRHYMAEPLVETLMASPFLPSLGGERQTVTILFLDFCDFTAITRSYPPDDVVRILNEYFSLLTTSVLENGGYLDKIMGDGLMALFNVPIPRSNHATLAVRSAIEMRKRIYAWNHEHASPLPLMNIRVGIHTGEAVVGNIGTSNLMNFTAIGREVNLAKRLEEEAHPGQILLTRTTLALLDVESLGLNSYQIDSIGRRPLRGFEQPIELFQIVDEATQPSLLAVKEMGTQ
jgi:adenylate cyclase